MAVNLIVITFFILAVFSTVKYGFIQFRAFKETKKILVNEKNKSSYSSFLVSLAAHIGTGNIVGISTALIYGGPGSLFWMWIFSLFSVIFSLMENTLAQVYKVKINGENRGGASFYILRGFNNRFLATLFSIFFLLTNTIFFQPLQVNTISESLSLVFGIDKIIILVLLFLFTYFVIFKGTKRIVRFCEHIVPIMSIGYISVTIMVILVNIKFFPSVITLILREAFSFKAITSGTATSCLIIGFKRSLFSNETGLGTAPSISAMADTKKPLQQGFVQVIGAFTDTIIICSLTGFMILIYQFDLKLYQGVDLIIYIFERILGDFGIYLALFFMLSFAIATVVSQFYLGESNLLFMVANNKRRKVFIFLYKILFLIGIAIGVNFRTKAIFGFVDQGMILLGCVNLYALYRLRNDFKREIRNYYN
ncbi:MAG TPA: alanine:cation symporter family protein [Acholeplasmataceae bacterium]|jgi:amino acid carrier protein|nr:alanine:cation symporter family protein [Acholeplasmataceae bacterium]